MGHSINESPMSWLALQQRESWEKFLARLTPQEKAALPTSGGAGRRGRTNWRRRVAGGCGSFWRAAGMGKRARGANGGAGEGEAGGGGGSRWGGERRAEGGVGWGGGGGGIWGITRPIFVPRVKPPNDA